MSRAEVCRGRWAAAPVNTYVATGPPHNNVLTGNVQVSGTNWPQGARQVIQQTGVQRSGGGGGFPTGYHQLVIGSNGLCLDVYGNSTGAGAVVDQWTCNGQANQQFEFVPVSGGYGQLRARHSGQALAVAHGSTTAGTPNIVQRAPDGSAGALWLPVRQSDGCTPSRTRTAASASTSTAAAATRAGSSTSGPARTRPAATRTSRPADRSAHSFTPPTDPHQ